MTRTPSLVVAVAALCAATALPAVATVGPGDDVPATRGCVSGPTAPGVFVAASGSPGYAVAAGARACEYLAIEPGGFASPVGGFTLQISRDGVTFVFDQTGARCGDDVVQVGDRVILTAEVAAEVGADSGCGPG